MADYILLLEGLKLSYWAENVLPVYKKYDLPVLAGQYSS